MAAFPLFLESLALMLSLVALVLVYLAVRQCRESEFVPLYYFIALSLAGVVLLSVSRIGASLYGPSFPLSSAIFQDLFLSYIALFLFGSLWQSYEASICVPPAFVDEE